MKNLNIATFDIEAKDWIDVLCLGFYDGKDYKLFRGEKSVNKFMSYLYDNINIYQRYKIYAHYGGIYDFLFLLSDFHERNLLHDVNLIIANHVILKMVYKNKDKLKLNFLDSGRILPKSLKELTTIFDVEHKKLDIDRAHLEKATDKEIETYLYNDVLGLYEVLIKTYNEFKQSKKIYPQLTLASTGYRAFNLTNKYHIEAINIKALDEFIRKTYRGGRVEIFKVYGKNLYYYDFNSLYPSVMLNNLFPIGKYINIPSNWRNFYENGYRGFGLFEIEAPQNLDIPLLPLKYNNKLLFPLGKFKDYYSFTEINEAINTGYDCKFIHGVISKNSVNDLFNEYILKCYNDRIVAKQNNNTVNDYINKILMNATYGKFGERKQKNRILFSLKNIEFENGKIEIFKDEPLIYLQQIDFNREYHNVGIASEITTLARLKLFNKMIEITNKGYELYYCDTDSIITDCPPDKLNVGNNLGDLKLECRIDEGIFISPKLYMLSLDNDYNSKNLKMKYKCNICGHTINILKDIRGEICKNCKKGIYKLPDIKFVHKGFKNVDIGFKDLKKAYFQNKMIDLVADYVDIAKFKSALIRKDVLRRKSPFLAVLNTHKEFKSLYDKRIIKGLKTYPIIIGDMERRK